MRYKREHGAGGHTWDWRSPLVSCLLPPPPPQALTEPWPQTWTPRWSASTAERQRAGGRGSLWRGGRLEAPPKKRGEARGDTAPTRPTASGGGGACVRPQAAGRWARPGRATATGGGLAAAPGLAGALTNTGLGGGRVGASRKAERVEASRGEAEITTTFFKGLGQANRCPAGTKHASCGAVRRQGSGTQQEAVRPDKAGEKPDGLGGAVPPPAPFFGRIARRAPPAAPLRRGVAQRPARWSWVVTAAPTSVGARPWMAARRQPWTPPLLQPSSEWRGCLLARSAEVAVASFRSGLSRPWLALRAAPGS
eukprot:353307-Chlamydomonas_euryale.AAC.1